MAVESTFSQDLVSRNIGGGEPRKKLKKVRSIRLSRVPSLKPSSRRSKSRCNLPTVHLFGDNSSPHQPSSVEVSDSSPNYMKATSCYNAKKGSYQHEKAGTENDDAKSIGSSTNKTVNRKLSTNGTIKSKSGLGKANKSFGSLKSFKRRPRSRLVYRSSHSTNNSETPPHSSSIEMSDASPNHLKATSLSEGQRLNFEASAGNSESNSDSGDQTKGLPNSQTTRTLVQVSEDLIVDRATCSSTLKDSKFPEHVDLLPGKTEAERISKIKVCHYHHCSLNGHCHDTGSPQKRFFPMRRRQFKTQKSMKQKNESKQRKKWSDDSQSENQMGLIGIYAEPLVQDEDDRSNTIAWSHAEGDKGIDVPIEVFDSKRNILDEVRNVARGSEMSFPSNLNEIKHTYTQATYIGLETNNDQWDASLQYCCEKTEDEVIASLDLQGQNATSSTAKGNADSSDMRSSELLGSTDDHVIVHCDEYANCDKESNENKSSNLEEIPKANDSDKRPKDEDMNSSSDFCANREQKAGGKEKNSHYGPEKELVTECAADGFSIAKIVDHNKNSGLKSSSGEVLQQQFKFSKEKHISMWHLIHQRMLSGLAAENSKVLKGSDEEKQVNHSNAPPAISSLLHESTSALEIGTENQDMINQEVEVRKLVAIKLVREAIEKILLPEVQDESSDGQSTARDTASGQELFNDNHIEASTHESDQESTERVRTNQSASKEVGLTTSIVHEPQEQKTGWKIGSHSDKRAPKHWSNLKKWILLQRFIKELEKVRKLNRETRKELPLPTDPEAEKVHLRPQTVEDRKRSEEWMLDYALQQAVSQLAPTQKRKVALLIKAFETVVPAQEDQHMLITFSKLNTNGEECSGITTREDDHASEIKDTESVSIVAASKPSDLENLLVTNKECDASDLLTAMVDGSPLQNGIPSKPENKTNSYRNDGPVDRKGHQETCDDVVLIVNPKDLVGDNKSGSKKWKLGGERPSVVNIPRSSDNAESTATEGYTLSSDSITAEKLISSASGIFIVERLAVPSEEKKKETNADGTCGAAVVISNSDLPNNASALSDISAEADGLDCDKSCSVQSLVSHGNENSETKSGICLTPHFDTAEKRKPETESEILLDSSLLVSKPDCKDNNETDGMQLDKRKYISMWHMICQNVLPGVATKVRSQLIDGTDDEMEVVNGMPEMKLSSSFDDLSKTNGEADSDDCTENYDASPRREGLSKNYAVKLIQEAVHEILKTPIQEDSCDTQSVNSGPVQDQGITGKKCGEVGEEKVFNSIAPGKEKCGEIENSEAVDDKKLGSVADGGTNRKEKITVEEEKSEQPKPKNWSKLKKLILLKRSIKALEQARKLNYSKPKLLLLTPDPEKEKVELRRQMIDERKRAEQWMLDYAVQNIVTKLTPTRKRRVAMLVEAFEAVVPLPEI